MALDVDSALLVNIGLPWAEVEKPQDACAKFLKDMQLVLGSQVPLTGWLHQVVYWRPKYPSSRHSLLGQVLMQIGLQLDAIVIRALDCPDSRPDGLQAAPLV